jgi:hypothetical protein
MRSFNVYLNGEKLCTAGIGDNGVLTTIVTWVAGGKGESLFLNVGGLVSSTEEHIDWANQKPLRVGDEVRIEIIESDSVDTPSQKRRLDTPKDINARKRYVRKMAKRLGLRVQPDARKNHSRKQPMK